MAVSCWWGHRATGRSDGESVCLLYGHKVLVIPVVRDHSCLICGLNIWSTFSTESLLSFIWSLSTLKAFWMFEYGLYLCLIWILNVFICLLFKGKFLVLIFIFGYFDYEYWFAYFIMSLWFLIDYSPSLIICINWNIWCIWCIYLCDTLRIFINMQTQSASSIVSWIICCTGADSTET